MYYYGTHRIYILKWILNSSQNSLFSFPIQIDDKHRELFLFSEQQIFNLK